MELHPELARLAWPKSGRPSVFTVPPLCFTCLSQAASPTKQRVPPSLCLDHTGDAARRDVPSDGRSGRLGEAIAGHHGLISLHLKVWGCPPHSGE